jgi:hypothetical protein
MKETEQRIGTLNTSATNSSGFTGLALGYRGNDGAFDYIGDFGNCGGVLRNNA